MVKTKKPSPSNTFKQSQGDDALSVFRKAFTEAFSKKNDVLLARYLQVYPTPYNNTEHRPLDLVLLHTTYQNSTNNSNEGFDGSFEENLFALHLQILCALPSDDKMDLDDDATHESTAKHFGNSGNDDLVTLLQAQANLILRHWQMADGSWMNQVLRQVLSDLWGWQPGEWPCSPSAFYFQPLKITKTKDDGKVVASASLADSQNVIETYFGGTGVRSSPFLSDTHYAQNDQFGSGMTMADLQAARKIRLDCRQEAARTINRALTAALNERLPSSLSSPGSSPRTTKKAMAVSLATLQFRVYFGLGQVNLCGNMIRAMSNTEDVAGKDDDPFLQSSPFSRGQRSELAYWKARYWLNKSDGLEQALQLLERAFAYCRLMQAKTACSGIAGRNAQRILHYLIPLRLVLKPTLKFKVCHLTTGRSNKTLYMTEAIKLLSMGDLDRYDTWVHANFALLCRYGTLHLWQKAYNTVGVVRGLQLMHRLYHEHLLQQANQQNDKVRNEENEAAVRKAATRLPLSIALPIGRMPPVTPESIPKFSPKKQPIDNSPLFSNTATSEKMEEMRKVALISHAISKGQVRGYLALQHGILVLAQKNAFPGVSSAAFTSADATAADSLVASMSPAKIK